LYDPKSKLVFRALAVKERRLDDALIEARLQRAVALRKRLFQGQNTTGGCDDAGDSLGNRTGMVQAGTASTSMLEVAAQTQE
jgi:hypothetical protein